LRVAAEQGFETAEEPLTLHDLYTSDECFCTATRIEVLPIVWIDGRQIGDGKPGPTTVKLMEAYIELAKREGTPIYAE
jgi:branched-chain amino acid aminotransferase